MTRQRQVCTVGDIVTHVLDRVQPQNSDKQGFVGLEHIGAGTLRLCGLGCTSTLRSVALQAQVGDVVFARLRPNFRKVVQLREAVAVSSEAFVLRAGPAVDSRYLLYLMAHPTLTARCVQASDGTRMPRVKWDFVASQRISLPPLEEQQRVGEKLGLLDDKLHVLGRMNEVLDDLTRAAFLQDVARGGRKERVLVADVVERKRDRVVGLRAAQEPVYVGLEHIPRRRAAIEQWGRGADVVSATHAFRSGDILYGRLRPNFHKVVPAMMSGVASPEVWILRPKQADMRWWLYGWLSSDAIQQVATAAAEGTRMPRVEWSVLAQQSTLLPNARDMEQYHKRVAPMFERMWVNVREMRALAQLRDRWMATAITAWDEGSATGKRGVVG